MSGWVPAVVAFYDHGDEDVGVDIVMGVDAPDDTPWWVETSFPLRLDQPFAEQMLREIFTSPQGRLVIRSFFDGRPDAAAPVRLVVDVALSLATSTTTA